MKYISIILWLILPLISISQTKSAQNTPPLSVATPESVGMSSERLSKIDDMCMKAIADGEIPGMVVLVARSSTTNHL